MVSRSEDEEQTEVKTAEGTLTIIYQDKEAGKKKMEIETAEVQT